MTHWTETYRGGVPPWQCDVTEHFTIAYYFDRPREPVHRVCMPRESQQSDMTTGCGSATVLSIQPTARW